MVQAEIMKNLKSQSIIKNNSEQGAVMVKKREDVTQSAVDDSKQGFMDNRTC